MKRKKFIFWTITDLFSEFMFFTSVPDILNVPDAVKFMSHLGYPNYFTPFIGIAKIVRNNSYSYSRLSADKRMGLCRIGF